MTSAEVRLALILACASYVVKVDEDSLPVAAYLLRGVGRLPVDDERLTQLADLVPHPSVLQEMLARDNDVLPLNDVDAFLSHLLRVARGYRRRYLERAQTAATGTGVERPGPRPVGSPTTITGPAHSHAEG